jgi:hypothetical protein
MSRQYPISLFSFIAKLLIGFCFLLQVTSLWAVEVKGLYEIEVPVEGQGRAARRAAIGEAFSQVLIKVTGRRQLNKRIQRNASRYVQQYRYRTIEAVNVDVSDELIADEVVEDKATEEAMVEADAVVEPSRRLWVSFDSTAVNRMLREKGVPIWGSARPSGIIWLSQEQHGKRTMLQPEMMPEVVLAVEMQAQQRGLPIMLPLMDMEDHQRLPVSALWAGFTETIQFASDRYGVEVVLTGRLVPEVDQWHVEWRLYQGESVEAWSGGSGSLSDLVAQGAESMSDRLAERYTQTTTDESLSQWRVVVNEIDDLAGYAKVNRYFESLVMVENVVLLVMEGSSAEFLLDIQGGEAALLQGVELGQVLEHLAVEPISEEWGDEVTEWVDETFEGPFLPEPIAPKRVMLRLR